MGNVSIPDRVLSLTAHKADPREDKYIANMLNGMESFDAAVAAGYSPKTAASMRGKKFSNDRFLARFVQACKGDAATILPMLNQATRKQVEQAAKACQLIDQRADAAMEEEDIDTAIDLRAKAVHLISKMDGAQERIAKVTGLIKDDKGPPQQPVIAIGEVQNLLLQVSNEHTKTQEVET